MMISTKGRYALMIMSYLASHQDEGLVSLKDIAESENIGIKYLEIIISALNKNELVESVRGKNGGYRLKHNAEEYTILDILTVAEGGIAPVACVDESFACENKISCKSHKLWTELDGVISDFLSKKTLADIM
ncbi:MAG: Rrf2 family transcriptional regulator [Eubacterium sp.]|nr:Rrf2 family transcriptional regulator [Eubacterium sp.]